MWFTKRLSVLIVLSILLVCFAGTAALQENEPVTLRFSWWGSETRHQRTFEVIELFEEKYPWITVEGDPMFFDDYWPVMEGQGIAGNLPDVVQHDYSRVQEWVDLGWLLPLDNLVNSGAIDLTDVAESVIDGGRIYDRLYAISMGTNSFGVVLDVDAFEEADMPLPSQDWTWTEFEEVCMELHERLDKWCIGGNFGNDSSWLSLWLGYGQLPYSADGKSLGYDDPQPMIDFLYMMLRLQEAGAIPNRAEQLNIESGTAEDEPVIAGDAVMANLWSNQLVALWNAAGEDRNFMMYHLPRPADGCCSENYAKPSQFLTISTHSDHPEEAAMLIDFITNSLEANRILLGERGVPISSVVQADLATIVTPAQAESFEFLSRVEKDSSPLPPPDPAVHGTIRYTVYEPIMRNAVMFGEITPEEAMELFHEQVLELLANQ